MFLFLHSRKLITGYPDNTFRPNATITRAEAAVLMLNAFPDAPKQRNAIAKTYSNASNARLGGGA